MRLSKEQVQLISEVIHRHAGADAEAYLFGSRLDDAAKGGDVDLFLETAEPIPLIQRAKIKMQLEAQLGLPVDLVCKARVAAATAFQTIARQNAVKLVN